VRAGHAVVHGADHTDARTFATRARTLRRVPTAARSRGSREARCCVRRRVNPVPSFSAPLQGPAAVDGRDWLTCARAPAPLLGRVTVLERATTAVPLAVSVDYEDKK
jgi:hypothetical protein